MPVEKGGEEGQTERERGGQEKRTVGISLGETVTGKERAHDFTEYKDDLGVTEPLA